MTVWVVPCRRDTPSITMVELPAPEMRAPILFRQSATSAISGSRAAFSITVWPSAKAAAISATCVPLTVTFGNTMSVPFSPLGALANTSPPSIAIATPSRSSAISSRSTGRVPMAQPPGIETRASPKRAISGAITQKLARIRETSS